jgi:hypothetical protein
MAFGHRVIRPRVGRFLDHRRVDGGAIGKHKSLAHAAWKAARAAEALPVAWIDKLWAGTLAAVAIAEQPAIQAKMLRRSEVLMRLLIDQAAWPRSREDMPPAADLRPKMHMGRHAAWDMIRRRSAPKA